MTQSQKTPNRLAQEKSPYLLQHQYNPVDWYAWSEEPFKKARREDKLIFLSIGYSTCHWCHVMERESFENEEIATLLNENFVSIKVDREERTDLDQIYMTAVQALTGSGGWPLTVFLTPDAKPVTGGTYFPPEDKWGRAGMKTILPKLAHLWKTDRDQMLKAGEEVTQLLVPRKQKSSDWSPSDQTLTKAYEQMKAQFDPLYGGFGSAPKFPRTHDLSFLLRYAERFKSDDAMRIVKITLDRMAAGGIYDHLGGGFSRYSTDQEWLVPHFEKMLYDQATLAKTYLEAFQAVQDEAYGEVARGIFEYVLRDLTDSAGGFYSAEDADSEGEEGKFYVWRSEEMDQVLEPDEAVLIKDYYGVTAEGNFENRTSILRPVKTYEELIKDKNISTEDIKRKIENAKKKLFEARSKRIRPHLDHKILTCWNGMMISAFALGASVLRENKYIEAASKAADFILNNLVNKNKLLRRYCDGEAAIEGMHDDYVFFIQGLLDLYEATFELKWLKEAERWTQKMLDLFWDAENGGFYYTAKDAEKLIARSKEYYDGAIPSSNSAAATLLLKMGRIFQKSDWEEKGEVVLRSNAEFLSSQPMNFTQLLIALDFILGEKYEVVFAGDPSKEDLKNLTSAYWKNLHSRAVVLCRSDSNFSQEEKLVSLLEGKKSLEGSACVYICKNFSCQNPVSEIQKMNQALS